MRENEELRRVVEKLEGESRQPASARPDEAGSEAARESEPGTDGAKSTSAGPDGSPRAEVSESRYRAIFEEASEGILIMPLDGSELSMNKAFARMHGYAGPEEMRHLDLKGLDTPETARLAPERLRRLREGEALDFEVEHFHRDGHTFFLKVSCRVIDIEGRLHYVGFHQDITERKRSQAEREELQSRLRQAEKMEAVGLLAGGVAHEFNNMLAVILGHADFALERLANQGVAIDLRATDGRSPDDMSPIGSTPDGAAPAGTSPMGAPHGDSMAADLREIRKAAERSAEVTRQLLSFARRQTAAPRQLDPNEVVSGMLQMIRRLVGEDIDIVWRPGASVGAVFMDPTQLHQVLVNLCVNARDAITGAGRITVETSSCALDERQRAGRAGRSGAVPGDFVMLAVSDDGCGMDPATVRRLFEPFFTTKELGRGTGLGLSTVDGIVRQNGGHLEVESEPGKGTSIRIYLPRCERAAAPAAVSESRSPRQGGETVLLVEDEPSVLALCARMLRGLGYRVLAASSPERALGLARQHEGRIHLLLSDVVMPQMNGRELARRLVAALPDLRCLFMSGYTAHVIAPQGFLGEGARFLQKPFSREELAAMVRAAIDD